MEGGGVGELLRDMWGGGSGRTAADCHDQAVAESGECLLLWILMPEDEAGLFLIELF